MRATLCFLSAILPGLLSQTATGAAIGEPCSSSTDCQTYQTECFKDICTCREGWIRINTTCRTLQELVPYLTSPSGRIGSVALRWTVSFSVLPAVGHFVVTLRQIGGNQTYREDVNRDRMNRGGQVDLTVTGLVEGAEYRAEVTTAVKDDPRLQVTRPSPFIVVTSHVALDGPCRRTGECLGSWCSNGVCVCHPQTLRKSHQCRSVDELKASNVKFELRSLRAFSVRWTYSPYTSISEYAHHHVVSWRPVGSNIRRKMNVTIKACYLTDLTPGTRYEVNITTVVLSEPTRKPTTIEYFSTLPMKPGPVTKQEVTGTTAYVTFAPVSEGGVDYYEASVRDFNASYQRKLQLFSPEFNLQGLQPSTIYYVNLTTYFDQVPSYQERFYFTTTERGGSACQAKEMQNCKVKETEMGMSVSPLGQEARVPLYAVALAAVLPSLVSVAMAIVVIVLIVLLKRRKSAEAAASGYSHTGVSDGLQNTYATVGSDTVESVPEGRQASSSPSYLEVTP